MTWSRRLDGRVRGEMRVRIDGVEWRRRTTWGDEREEAGGARTVGGSLTSDYA